MHEYWVAREAVCLGAKGVYGYGNSRQNRKTSPKFSLKEIWTVLAIYLAQERHALCPND